MKRATALFVLFLSCLQLFGQKKGVDYCSYLQEVLESKEFNSNFHFTSDTTLVLIDTANIFLSCNSLTINGRKVEVIHNCPSYFSITRNREINQKIEKNDFTKIVVVTHWGKHEEFLIYFWHPCSNGDALFEVGTKQGNLYSKLRTAGVF